MDKNTKTIVTDNSKRTETLAVSILSVLGFLFAIAFGVYALSLVLDESWTGPVIGVGILFVLPACLAAIVSLSMDPYGMSKAQNRTATLLSVLLVLGLGGIVLQEGIICILMLLPLWIFGVLMGIFAAEKMQVKNKRKDKMQVSVLAMLPFVVLFADIWLPQVKSEYRVTREIVIEAGSHDIWPHLLKMDDIKPTEGKWTFAQNIMQIPRPRAAIVHGHKTKAVRHARWGEHIRFEENVTIWAHNKRLHWDFAFADTSISDYTDRHISPKGKYLDIKNGGYRLEPMGAGRTKLILETNYSVSTPINLYGKVWGEIILGGLQNNILSIVRARAEDRNISTLNGL